jgi:hypothetical protein
VTLSNLLLAVLSCSTSYLFYSRQTLLQTRAAQAAQNVDEEEDESEDEEDDISEGEHKNMQALKARVMDECKLVRDASERDLPRARARCCSSQRLRLLSRCCSSART